MNIIRKAASMPIIIYRKFISPLKPPCCRYYPSCSSYALQAVEKHGVIKGALLGGWRLLRCNPFARGGVDYVPEKFTFTVRNNTEKHMETE